MPLIPQVQARPFHEFTHSLPPEGGCWCRKERILSILRRPSMRCCLSACRSRPTTSRQVSSMPSMRLITIRTCGSIGEFARLDSSSTTPSNRSSTVAGNSSAGGRSAKVACRPRSSCGRSSEGVRRRAFRTSLLLSSLGRLIVRDTPFVGTLPLMVPPATERTTQVPAMSILGIREKPNPAVSAANDATLKLRMGLQGAVQRGQILLDKRPGAILLVPIRLKRENLLDGDDKKARLSVIMLIVLSTPSSYFREANASRGRARFFALQTNIPTTTGTNDPLPIAPPGHPVCQVGADSLPVTS